MKNSIKLEDNYTISQSVAIHVYFDSLTDTILEICILHEFLDDLLMETNVLKMSDVFLKTKKDKIRNSLDSMVSRGILKSDKNNNRVTYMLSKKTRDRARRIARDEVKVN